MYDKKDFPPGTEIRVKWDFEIGKPNAVWRHFTVVPDKPVFGRRSDELVWVDAAGRNNPGYFLLADGHLIEIINKTLVYSPDQMPIEEDDL